MKSDLHCHSTASDGMLTPRELVDLAHKNEIELLALTDHDTLAGIPDFTTACQSHGIEALAGIELSTRWNGIGIHIVGLKVDPDAAAMESAVTFQTDARQERAEKIASRLEKQGFTNVLEGATALADPGGSLGRPHFARFLVESGQIDSQARAFSRFLGAGKIGDVKCGWPEMEQVVEWITQAGGVAILAHPDKYSMSRLKLRRLLQDFCAVGGQAVEVVSGQQNRDVTAFMARMANEHELYASAGSDFHGPVSNWHNLGSYSPLPGDVIPVETLWSENNVSRELFL